MIPKKGGVAERRGIKFSGNPGVKDRCEKEKEKKEKRQKPNVIDNPGRFLVDSLS